MRRIDLINPNMRSVRHVNRSRRARIPAHLHVRVYMYIIYVYSCVVCEKLTDLLFAGNRIYRFLCANVCLPSLCLSLRIVSLAPIEEI